MPLCTIPLACTALTYLWTLADNGKITKREAFIGTGICSQILKNDRIVRQLKQSIEISNLSKTQFVDAYKDLSLVDWELEALYHALTR